MEGPKDVGALSNEEKRDVKKLETEITDHFRRASAGVPYRFEPNSIGAAEFTERVLNAAIANAKKAGWKVTGDATQGFEVRKP